jgi:hypothetical protein
MRMDRANRGSGRERRVRLAAAFLAISYGIGAPLTAFIEYRSHALSQRFNYPPELIYLTCAVQLACAMGVLVRPLAPWAVAVLTVITLGAMAAHLQIGSPLTALPALLFTVVQVWFGLNSYRRPERTAGT